MPAPSYGVIVGRFQVHELHDGHMELLRTVCGLHNRVIVFLGTPPTLATRRNPLDFETRRRMLQAKFPAVTVSALPDQPSDELWSRTLDSRIREMAPYGSITLYGGRDSFAPSYVGAYKPVQELPLHIKNTSGEEVRAEVSSRIMESSDFRAGVIYSTQNRFPAAIMCTDAAIVDEHCQKILLGKKKTDNGWRFIGGHVDPRDGSLEDCVKREVLEETGLYVERTEYVGSFKIDDWRWTKETDKLFTALFLCVNSSGAAIANDDIAQVKWLPLSEIKGTDIEPAHRSMFYALINFIQRKEKDAQPVASNR